VRTSAEPNLRVCVFGITGGKDEEVQQIAAVSRHVADRLGAISLSIVGRGSAEVEDRLNSLLTGSRTSLHVLGVAPSESVSRGLSESDALLFVRSEISSRRGTAVAGIAHGLPVVGYEGPETAWPVTEAGLALAPMNDVQALAENLIRLATYIDWAKELSDRSRTAYKLHFAWPRIAERFVEVISDQAGDGQQAIPTAGSAHS
jgi:glycosyltransferase involved in cell wall biosynthesis